MDVISSFKDLNNLFGPYKVKIDSSKLEDAVLWCEKNLSDDPRTTRWHCMYYLSIFRFQNEQDAFLFMVACC